MQSQGNVYFGDQWILYTDTDGTYNESEMLAPCLLIAEPGCVFVVTDSASVPSNVTIGLFAAGVVNQGRGCGCAFLYFDPISAIARSMHRTGDAIDIAGTLALPQLHWTDDFFKALVHGALSAEEVRTWVGLISSKIAAALPPPGPIDAKLLQVGKLLAADTGGRLSVGILSDEVHWSSDHLRKEFKKVVGMTLSRYQMWHRFCMLMEASCVPGSPTLKERNETSLFSAGFYDTPHANRNTQKFWALPIGTVLHHTIGFSDCRTSAASLRTDISN